MIIAQYKMVFGKRKINVYHGEFSALADQRKDGGLEHRHATIGAFYQFFFGDRDTFFTRFFIAPAAKPVVLIK